MENKTIKKLFLMILVSFFILTSISAVKAASCIDSDGKDYYEKGRVLSSTGKIFIDSCIDSTTVKEWVCGSDNKAWYYSYSRSGYLCDDGKLIKNTGICRETDNGKDYYDKGTSVSSTGKTFTDYCTSATTVKEFYCWSDQLVYNTEYSRAGYICKDGELVLNTGECRDTDGGKDYYTKGTATSSTGAVRTDYCVDLNTVKEFYCGSDELVYNQEYLKEGYMCHDGELIEQSEMSFCMDYEYECREHYFCPLGHKCIENNVTYCNVPCQRICANNHAYDRTLEKYRVIWCKPDEECPCQEKVEGDYGCFKEGESCYGALKDCYCPDECEPGETETKQCGQTDIGECSYGTQERECTFNHKWGSWGSCVGAVYPAEEICDELDNDCDGETDEDGVCNICVPGETETKQCDQTDVGECSYGTQTRTCVCGQYWSDWSECTGAVYPTEEICDGLDNDCDGLIDEGGVCWECTTDNDCNHLDNDYCECSYKVMHDEGKCINHECVVEITQVQDCNDLDEYYCDDTNIMYDDYWCVDAECVIKSTDFVEDCDDGLFCNGQETCENANCVAGIAVDCSDGNECTDNICNEDSDQCENLNLQAGTLCGQARDCLDSDCNDVYAELFPLDGHDTCDGQGNCIEYSCEMLACYCSDDDPSDGINTLQCGAECDQDSDCPNTFCGESGCIGNDYYTYYNVPNTCLGDCTCTENECCGPEISYNDLRCFDCIPNEEETISCYEGPEGTEGVGICISGTKTRTCDSEGQWSQYGECTGAVYPAEEICDSKDNDCDDLIDEDRVCDICVPGEQQTRLCGLTDVGECEYGTQTRTCICGQYWTNWSDCIGAVYPTDEICDELDNDCDGEIDEDGVCDIPLLDMNSVLGITRFSIINEDYLRPGESLIIITTLENNGNVNLDNIRLTFVIPELNIRMRVGPFDIKRNKETTKLIILDIPYWARPGYYDIRATASNGDVRRVKHREILIHN